MPNTTTTTIVQPPATDQMTQLLKGVMPLIPFLFQLKEQQKAERQMALLEKQHALQIQTADFDKSIRLFSSLPPRQRSAFAKSKVAQASSHNEPNNAEFWGKISTATDDQITAMGKISKKLQALDKDKNATIEDVMALQMELAVEVGDDAVNLMKDWFNHRLEMMKLKGDKFGTVTLQSPDGKMSRTFDYSDTMHKNIARQLMANGWTEVKTPSVQINMPDPYTKATKGKLEETVIEADKMLDFIGGLEGKYRDEFSSFMGAKGASAINLLDRLYPGLPSEKQRQFLTEYTNWAADVDMQNLLYRKFITGVAGGAQEMAKIEKTFINSKDSPTKYKAKVALQKENTRRGKQRAQFALQYFGGRDFSQLTPEEKAQVVARFPFLEFKEGAAPKPQNPSDEADAYLKELGLK